MDRVELQAKARVLDGLGLAVIATDLAGVVTFWNRHAEELYGWTCAEATGRAIFELTVAPVGQPHAEEIMATVARGGVWTGVFPVRHKDGTTFTALVTNSGLPDATGRLVGVVGASVNIGETLRPYLVHGSEAAVVLNPTGTVYYASPAVSTIFGWDDRAIIGRDLLDLVHDDDRDAVRASLGGAESCEFRARRQDGSYVWTEARWVDMRNDPSLHGVLGTLRDIDDRHLVLDQLTALALHDSLTGLANRAVVIERLAHAVARRDRQGALLFLDLDDFKQVNDQLGHAAGDDVLRTVAGRLQVVVRPEDLCGRWAGDEFVVLADDVRSREAADALVHRLTDALAEPIVTAGAAVRQQVSVGVAMLADTSHNADALLHLADDDMYRVKLAHRATSPAAPGSI